MKKLFSVICIFSSLLLSGQNDIGSSNIKDGYKATRDGVKGHPFFLEEWVVGYGIMPDSSLTKPEMFNYDIHQNNLTYKTGDGANDIMTVTNESLIGFILKDKGGDKTFLKINKQHFDKNKKENKFYLVLDSSTKYVILEPIKKLDDPNASGWSASSSNTKSAEYDYKENLYILNGDHKFVLIKLNKSSVLNALKDKRSDISNFISSKNIDLDDPKDLIQIMQFYHNR